jgi:hypothetical protein
MNVLRDCFQEIKKKKIKERPSLLNLQAFHPKAEKWLMLNLAGLLA